jgi:DNA-binding NtrC family response regulator
MTRPNLVLIDADQKQCREVCAWLKQLNYAVAPLFAPDDLNKHLDRDPIKVVLVDLDTVAVDNNFFRTLKKQHPHICVLVFSSLPYHPGLEESMGSYIYACLAKPLDSEELIYWLKSICENQPTFQEVPKR